MDVLTQHLKCPICLDVATLPVHLTCCEKTRTNPACESCVKTYLQLNREPKNRKKVKSFTTCGCVVNVKKNRSFYRHAVDLWTLRDAAGTSACPNEKCGASFSTSAELRRHLEGATKKSDKFEACGEQRVKCESCAFRGPRRVVLGDHAHFFHTFFYCHVCEEEYVRYEYAHHMNSHKQHLVKLLEEHRGIELELERRINLTT